MGRHYDIEAILADGVTLELKSAGAAAYDLIANIDEPLLIRPQAAPTLVPTGVRLNMSAYPCLAALVLPRSGTGNKGLVLGNTVGLIDSDYQGEILISAWNRNPYYLQRGMGNEVQPPIKIHPGDRIAQLLFIGVASPSVSFEEVDEFSTATERGEGGYGSTGTNG